MATPYTNLPSISVVVPSYNQGQFLRDTLESIVRQEYPRVEIVVMDGGSTDDSIDIIRSYEAHLAYWQSQPDGGQSAAINAGMQHCTGDLVTWLNSDDFYWNDALWQVGRAYAMLSERGLYLGNGLRYNQKQDVYSPFCRHHLALNRAALLLGLDYILQPSAFFLRSAWESMGGLNPALRYCMDWDLLIRLSAHYSAVLINEFLAVSREYDETKTSSGKIGRMVEINQMIQSHTQQQITPGSLFYSLETLLDVSENLVQPNVRSQLYQGMNALREQFTEQYGNGDGFPELCDPQDEVYLPLPNLNVQTLHPPRPQEHIPSISVITPSFNQAQFLGQTLDSILGQQYPRLETLVFDGGSTDGSIDVLRKYSDRITYWESEPDRGPAHAINKGFARATGEIVGWVNSDDLLATDALWEVARAFANDPELDMLYANALYIDEQNKLFLADHGTHRTAFYRGEIQPTKRIPAYWLYVHAVPQPTVFFRRSLLEACGPLDEQYHFIFDFELFWRFVRKARKVQKLERTQAFYRIHAASKTSDWNKFLVELYRFSRPFWPKVRTPQFRSTLRSFLSSYMNRRFGSRPRDIWYWGAAAAVGTSAITRIGNPENFQVRLPAPRQSRPASPVPTLPQTTATALPPAEHRICRRDIRYQSLFCTYHWPRHPGHSGGEIRDFHLLRHLLSISTVEFFTVDAELGDSRANPLQIYTKAVHTPDSLRDHRPDLVHLAAFNRPFRTKLINQIARAGIPMLGPRYHRDVAHKFPLMEAYCRAIIQETLVQSRPDFLFIGPQTNPLALMLHTDALPTRMVMTSYDVEAVRMRRIAASAHGLARAALDLEAQRAAAFERENLACYDGVIAVSELDKRIFVQEYGIVPERVLVIENGVDPQYFTFVERKLTTHPQIMFVGSLSYISNQQAAWRLIDRIMPLLWQRYPEASVWIVGQGADPNLLSRNDQRRVFVTGRVEDVRPYLAQATAACVPLISGSGTKYKVLEALSAGVPIVCTPLAAEGLELTDGQHVLLGDTDAELAAALIELFENPALANILAHQGRMLVERCYAWEANLARLDRWLEDLRALPRRTKAGLQPNNIELVSSIESNTTPERSDERV